jgi:hypothetical protein
MKKCILIAFIVIPCIATAWPFKDKPDPKSGTPTPLTHTNRPVATLYALQEEFLALKTPVLIRFKHHRAYKTLPSINCPSMYYPAFYEPCVTREARAYLKRHSRLELIVALLPYIDDPELGVEAILLLTAIPCDMHVVRTDVSIITTPIHSAGYKSPSEKGLWDPNNAIISKTRLAQMVHLGNTCTRWYSDAPTHNTLEEAIIAVLENYEKSSFSWNDEDVISFADSHNKALALSAIYPKVFWPHNNGENWTLGVLIHGLGLHEKFDNFTETGNPCNDTCLDFNKTCSKTLIKMVKMEALDKTIDGNQ